MVLLSRLQSRGMMTRLRPAVSIVVLQSVKRVILPIAALLCVIVGLGLLVTKVLYDDWPFTAEDALNRELAGTVPSRGIRSHWFSARWPAHR